MIPCDKWEPRCDFTLTPYHASAGFAHIVWKVCGYVVSDASKSVTLAVEQEVAHIVAEGAGDVAASVGQAAREAAAVERAERVGAEETNDKKKKYIYICQA